MDMTALPDKPTYRVSEVASYYGVTERTVYIWIERGQLKTVQTPGGQSRIPREALDKYRLSSKDGKKE